MKKPRFSETQIVSILKEADAGMPVTEVCRQHGGLGASELQRIKELEAGNAKLKRMYAGKAMEP